MAGPNWLPYGEALRYPTWQAGKTTRLSVQNADPRWPGKVHVSSPASFESEDVVVLGNTTTSIDRDWAGMYIDVRNTGGPDLTVWTE